MYCPKCGSQTLDEAKFCRGCGADVSLVPMAITGQLTPVSMPPPPSRDIQRSQARAITNTMTGFGFLVVAFSALIFAPAGHLWWFWMLIPAFALMGTGLAAYARYRTMIRGIPGMPLLPTSDDLANGRASLKSGFTGALPPPSVSEVTTRHLGDRIDRSTE